MGEAYERPALTPSVVMPHRDPPPSSLRLLAPGPSILEVGESLTSGVGGGATRELEGAEPEELKKPGTYGTTVRPGHTPLVWPHS